MTGRIFQFGTSRFLQAHVGLFAHQAREAGQVVSPITIVQVTDSIERAHRVAAFNDPNGYPVAIRGLSNGAPTDCSVQVTSVANGLSARTEWNALVKSFVEEATHVVSNVGDNGYAIPKHDMRPGALVGAAPPHSYPAMLVALLFCRWRANAAPLAILPCELLVSNGDRLREAALTLAEAQFSDLAFHHWLRTANIWVNTLVDRIVSEPLEPAGAVTEPYALWAIEKKPGLEMPFTHPAVVLTDDLRRYERFKLFILNLGHTSIAQRWIDQSLGPDMTVGAFLSSEGNLHWLRQLYSEEVLPTFSAAGLASDAEAYVEATIQRFKNPFLRHRISDIANDHHFKVKKRIGAFLDWKSGLEVNSASPYLMSVWSKLDASEQVSNVDPK